jgi:hypothetical protein
VRDTAWSACALPSGRPNIRNDSTLECADGRNERVNTFDIQVIRRLLISLTPVDVGSHLPHRAARYGVDSY